MAKPFYTGIDLKGQKIVNLADGSLPNDGVTLQQMQAFARGLSWKDAARACATTNINLAAPGASIDGVAMALNDRFLAPAQTAGAERGIYIWNGGSAAATRALDNDSAAEMRGATVFITEGTTNADKAFTQTVDNVTLGTTALNWAQFGGGSAAYTAGNGLALTSNSFSVLLDANSGLLTSGNGLKLDTSVAVRKFAVTIGDGTATSFTITHNLGTLDVTWSLREVASGVYADTDVVAATVNTLTMNFATAPAAGFFRVTVHG